MAATARAVLVAAALLTLPASAQERGSSVRLGGAVGILMRQEAGGHRTPLPALALDAGVGGFGPAELTALYQFSFAAEGTVVSAFTQHHRVHLRGALTAKVGAALFTLSVGPGLGLVHTSVSEPGALSFRHGYLRPLVGGGLTIGIPLGRTTLRSGVEGIWSPGRLDVLVAVGGVFDLGVAR